MPRWIGLVLGGMAVAAALLQSRQPAWVWVALAANALAWPALAFLIATRDDSPTAAEKRNLLADSTAAGFWIAAMGFNALPSALLATMTSMNNLAVGGWRFFRGGVVAQSLGVAAGLAVLPHRWSWVTTETTLIASLPLLAVYPLMVGMASYRLALQVTGQRKAIGDSELLHRETLDAMEAGVVLYDAQGRLKLCNEDFRRLYAPIASELIPGMTFEQLLRRAIEAGLIPAAAGQEADWIEERLRQHAQPKGAVLRQMANGTWRRIVERRLSDGSVLAFSTDVTDLVHRERELQEEIRQREAIQSQLRNANRMLEELAETDSLTGVANRRQFDRRLGQEWRRARRQSAPLSLLLIDIDFFKQFNDRAGHVEGDLCLKEVASALAGCARRSGEFLARYGGEEFVALLPGVGLDGAVNFATACAEALRDRRLAHPDSPVGEHVTVSIGVSSTEGRWMSDSSELIRSADHALYEAKAHGRNRVVADRATSARATPSRS